MVEWGGAPRPARFVLAAGSGNQLFAELTNVARLRVRVAESPFDRTRPLQVAVNGTVPLTIPAPLPENLVLARGEKGWVVESADEPLPFRLHTPGSAALLYNGEPLLIVYGTQGAAAPAMRAAAEAAAKSPNPVWLDDSGDAGPDGVPHSQNLYGRLNLKADTAVTDADLARCHLVLIGTAEENRLVARMRDRLPVRLEADGVTCADGMKFTGKHLALGLVHYNPLAPTRLVFWVASADPATYAAGSMIARVMGGGTSISASVFGADLVVLDATAPVLVAAREFDSRWRWTADRAASPRLPAAFKTSADFSATLGAALRAGTGADYALVGTFGPAAVPVVTPGVTRGSDLRPMFYNLHVGTCEMTGAEIREVARKAAAAGQPALLVVPAISGEAGGPAAGRTYRVALSVDQLWTLSAVAQLAPRAYEHTDLLVSDALERYLARE